MFVSRASSQCRSLSIASIARRSRSSSLPAACTIIAGQTTPKNDTLDNNNTIRHPARQRHQSYHSTSTPNASAAQLIKQLREATGAPMMECKKALSSPEVNNDIQLAKDWLRKHGSAKASSKVMGRDALEGLVGLQIVEVGGAEKAALVKVASETDFASRSEVFSSFVQEVADAAAASSAESASDDIPGFVGTCANAEGKLLSERLNAVILSIRENLQVNSISTLTASSPNSVVMGYVHGRVSPSVTCGSAASVVELEMVGDDKDSKAARDAAKKLAMHVVAAKPQYLDPASVPEDVVQKEKAALMGKLEGSNKPPAIQEKIVGGQLRKFYEGICLTEQMHMAEDGNPKVSKVMKDLGLEVKGFRIMGMTK